MSQVQPIEGISPEMLWNFVLVLLGLCAVVILVYKVVEIVRKERERRAHQQRFSETDLTDEIAKKVLEKLEPRLAEIDRKLTSDKARLDDHESSLRAIQKSNAVVRDGLRVSCEALAAVLDHELHNGNGDQMQKARDDLQKYTNSLIGLV